MNYNIPLDWEELCKSNTCRDCKLAPCDLEIKDWDAEIPPCKKTNRRRYVMIKDTEEYTAEEDVTATEENTMATGEDTTVTEENTMATEDDTTATEDDTTATEEPETIKLPKRRGRKPSKNSTERAAEFANMFTIVEYQSGYCGIQFGKRVRIKGITKEQAIKIVDGIRAACVI